MRMPNPRTGIAMNGMPVTLQPRVSEIETLHGSGTSVLNPPHRGDATYQHVNAVFRSLLSEHREPDRSGGQVGADAVGWRRRFAARAIQPWHMCYTCSLRLEEFAAAAGLLKQPAIRATFHAGRIVPSASNQARRPKPRTPLHPCTMITRSEVPHDVSAYLSVEYEPRWPRSYRPKVALIGCGKITRHHLTVYRNANLPVVALCDVNPAHAEERRREFYPDANVYTDYRDVMRLEEVEVVDIATHPPERPPIIAAALEARKHVLSQKPFVTDLAVGRRLVQLAERKGVYLAVNQNGRWAPHWSYLRTAIAQGLLGTVHAATLSVHWNHGWVAGTPFERLRHVILFDYAIHWFDIVRCFFPGRSVRRVYAAATRSSAQTIRPALLAQVSIELPDALVSLTFHADTRFTSQDRTIVCGDRATAISVGPNEKVQTLTVHVGQGAITPALKGCWFPDGFAGTMGELLRAIDERRPPTISAEENLKSLELCFAAVGSAERHEPLRPGQIRHIRA